MNTCKGVTNKGERCKRICNSEYCFNHIYQKPITGINECCVCLDSKTCETLDCKHFICMECLYNWSLSKDFKAGCPMCRADIGEPIEQALLAVAFSKHDVIKHTIYQLPDEGFDSIESIPIKFNALLTKKSADIFLRIIRFLNEDLYGNISVKTEIKKVDKSCDCDTCKSFHSSNSNEAYVFLRPANQNGLGEMIEWIRRIVLQN
jgi:hypothetical protein